MTHPWEILLGPPGTGKTTRLLGILRDELAAGTPPDRIGFVTFTRKAAQEAQDRVLSEFRLTRDDTPWFRTLHSLCMRVVGMAGGSIFQGVKIREFAEWIGEKIEGRQSTDGSWAGYERGDRMMFMSNLARIRRVSLRALYECDHDQLDWAALDKFDRGLRDYKTVNHLHDFTDMLELFVAGGARPNLEVLLVDEGQDLSLLQWDVVRELAANCRRTVVAGDDDQAIFVWAGADVDTLIDLPGRADVLDYSWRVPKLVQRVAGDVIGRVSKRREKQWRPRDADGSVRWLSHVDQAEYGETGDGTTTMVLTRNRHQLDPVEASLRAAGILYEREGFPSVKRSVLDQIVVWERLRRGEPQIAADVVRTYELMSLNVGVKRGHKKLPAFDHREPVTLQDLRDRGGLLTTDVWHRALDLIAQEDRSYLIRCRRRRERLTLEPRVKLSTIHGSKGGEATRVVLLTDLAPRTWREYHSDPDSEARVFYVACTRAREELCIVQPTTPRSYPV